VWGSVGAFFVLARGGGRGIFGRWVRCERLSYRARLGGLPISGAVIRHAKAGYLCLSAPDSIIALFVEKSRGSSMQTIQWILFGDARRREAEVRHALAGLTIAPAPLQT
jgi:hypothetical protein